MKINRGWLDLANSNLGGLSARNLLPWATTGPLGQKLLYNSFVGGAWDLGAGLGKGVFAGSPAYATNCSWGGL
jgi:hypothetical protein